MLSELSFLWFPATLYFLLLSWRLKAWPHLGELYGLVLLSMPKTRRTYKIRAIKVILYFFFWNILFVGSLSALYSLQPTVLILNYNIPSFWYSMIVFALLFFVRKIIKIKGIDF